MSTTTASMPFMGFTSRSQQQQQWAPPQQQSAAIGVQDEDDLLTWSLLFGESSLGGHFYSPLMLSALDDGGLGAAGVAPLDHAPISGAGDPFSTDDAADLGLDVDALATLQAQLEAGQQQALAAAAAAPALVPMDAPQVKSEAVRTVIATPFAKAAAKEALKALPPSSTAITKRRTHNKQEQQQKRRERNRVLAKRTRLRKKFMFQSLQTQVSSLHSENERLKSIVRERLGTRSGEVLSQCCAPGLSPIVASCARQATALLQRSDFLLMKALQNSQPSFCISDPTLPDCPIVFASDGFIALTGYAREQVVGRNCRFLQGPDTDPEMVAKLRRGIEEGRDTSVFLRNYNAAGEPFWNHVFVASLRDSTGRVVNHVGIQHAVENPPSQEVLDAIMKDDNGIMRRDTGSDGDDEDDLEDL